MYGVVDDDVGWAEFGSHTRMALTESLLLTSACTIMALPPASLTWEAVVRALSSFL